MSGHRTHHHERTPIMEGSPIDPSIASKAASITRSQSNITGTMRCLHHHPSNQTQLNAQLRFTQRHCTRMTTQYTLPLGHKPLCRRGCALHQRKTNDDRVITLTIGIGWHEGPFPPMQFNYYILYYLPGHKYTL